MNIRENQVPNTKQKKTDLGSILPERTPFQSFSLASADLATDH
jgi:hypothetical protein